MEGLGWDADDGEDEKAWRKRVWSKRSESGVQLKIGGGCGGRWEGGRELKERVVEGARGRCRRLRGMFEGSVERWRGLTGPGRSVGGRDESGECGCCKLPEGMLLVFVRDRKKLLLTSMISYHMLI